MHTISSNNVVVGPGCIDEPSIVLSGEEGVRKVPEKLLQQTSNAVHVMKEIFRVAEIKITRIGICERSAYYPQNASKWVKLTRVEHILQLLNMRR